MTTREDAATGEDLCVVRVPIFQALAREDQIAVAGYAHPRRLRADEFLGTAGQGSGHLFVVHTGRVALLRTTADGRDTLVRVAGPGDVVGEHEFLTGRPPAHHTQALEETQLCVFSHEGLSDLVAAHPQIAVSMLRELSALHQRAEHRLAMSARDVDTRLADYLVGLVQEARSRRVHLPLRKRDTASYLGTTPESLSRALARLRREGLVSVDGSEVTVLDLRALADRAA